MKDSQFVEQKVKNLYKVSKHLYGIFRGIKKLAMRYLHKVKKLDIKKKAYESQREQLKKKEEADRKRKQKMAQRKEKDKEEKARNEAAQQNKNAEEEKQAEKRPIYSIIKNDKNQSKLKSNRPTQKSQPKKSQKSNRPQTSKQKQKKIKAKEQEEPVKLNKPLVKPSEPPSAFNIFLKSKKKEINATRTAYTLEKITEIMRKIWEKMNDIQKSEFVRQHIQLKMQYERDLNTYYKQLDKYREVEKAENQGKKDDEFDFIDQLEKM